MTPLTALPGYKSDFVQEYKHPQQLYARFEELAAQNPDIAEIVRMPNKTNGYQRKAQATIGGTGQSAVVVSTAAWGHEGGNEVTVEFVAQTGNNLPLTVAGQRQGRARAAGHERDGRARRAPRPRSRRRSRPARRA